MSDTLCEVCRHRPATHTVEMVQDGLSTVMQLCTVDFAELHGHNDFFSPFEALFGHNPFLMGAGQEQGQHQPRRQQRRRESFDFDRVLSDHAKELLQAAAHTAGEYGRPEVDTEHLLHALTNSDVIGEILKRHKVKPEDIRGYIEENAPRGEATFDEGNRTINVSPRLKTVIDRAFNFSREMRHGYLGPEHLLLGMAGEEGMGGDVLRKFGLKEADLRASLLKVVGAGAREGRVEQKSQTPQLDKFGRDLTKLASEGKLDPVIGRATEIESTIEILSRRTKNNPVLIGEPGVGKTAIAEGLAQRIASGEVPEILEGKRVVELSVNSIVAGSKYRGELEERMKAVLDEIRENRDELVIFVDELHTIVGAGTGGGEGGLDLANVMKPALARGELHLVGATTLSEYQKHIEKDAALERRFQPVLVPEPTVEQTIEILRGLRDKYEAHHRIKITDEAVVAAAELAQKYLTNRFMPDKAIDLIDQAAARVRIQSTAKSREVRELEEKLVRLRREQEQAASRRQFEEAARLERQIKDAEKAKAEAQDAWTRGRGTTTVEVRREDIAQVVSKLTGIPATELSAEERERLLALERRLHERVVGQEEAVQAVSDAIRRSRAGLRNPKRPTATFLFLGPTGVGKTELARSLAWLVYGSEDAMVRVDMSEYGERHATSRLVGAPPGYVGYEEAGQLTEAVRRRPYSLVLLDEVEKAHPEVHNILLQLLDDGRLTDGKGRVVDFSNTIIIMTSNVGAQRLAGGGSELGFKDGAGSDDKGERTYQQMKTAVMDELRSAFRPEFINRIDEVIVFRPLSAEQVRLIVSLELAKLAALARGQGIGLKFDDSVIDHLAQVGYAPEYGAREVRRQIGSRLETVLAREMLGGKVKEGDHVMVRYDAEKEQFAFEPAAVAKDG